MQPPEHCLQWGVRIGWFCQSFQGKIPLRRDWKEVSEEIFCRGIGSRPGTEGSKVESVGSSKEDFGWLKVVELVEEGNTVG